MWKPSLFWPMMIQRHPSLVVDRTHQSAAAAAAAALAQSIAHCRKAAP